MSLTPDQIREVVFQTLNADRSGSTERVAATVKAVFDLLGVNVEDEVELRQLRSGVQRMIRWDQSIGQIEKAGRKTAITILITGILGALWLGIMDTVTKPLQKLFH